MSSKRKMFRVLGMSTFVLGWAVALWAADNNHAVPTVWTMSNDTAGNVVLAFGLVDGRLTPRGSFPTGGTGSGGREPDFGLGNAHALQLSGDGQFLFVVNPGSNDISSFAVGPNSLTLIERVPSGGLQPLSVAVNGGLLYVLNAGGNVGGVDNITGFRVGPGGTLNQINNSTRPLSAVATAPAQIQFTRDGRILVVTEKSTNVIDTYTIGADGRATGPIVTPSVGQTPFGFDIANANQLFVSDDFNDAPGLGAMSSYTIGGDGTLKLVSSVVPAIESGACWVAVNKEGTFAYLTNTVSSVTSIYSINPNVGSVALDTSFASFSHATDLAFNVDGGFLFALAPDQTLEASPAILAWRVNSDDGSVTPLPGVSRLPRSVDGLAVR